MNVSVAVISYNSSETIIDTLESVLAQTYGSEKIELIISDDASKDNTNQIIDKWLSVNQGFFYNTKFIKNFINKGVSANCNQAWRASSCEWIKSIAGDDMLESDCIKFNINYINKNPESKIVFSKMRWFGNIQKVTPSKYNMRFFKKDSKKQNNWLKCFSFNIAPASFISREALESIGYADESYRTIEDLPLWLKFTAAGYKLHFLDLITVNYRASESTSMSSDRFVNVDFLNDLISINKSQAKSFWKNPVNEYLRFEQLIMFYCTLLISKVFKNKKNKYSIAASYMTWVFRPVHYLRHIWIKIYNFTI